MPKLPNNSVNNLLNINLPSNAEQIKFSSDELQKAVDWKDATGDLYSDKKYQNYVLEYDINELLRLDPGNRLALFVQVKKGVGPFKDMGASLSCLSQLGQGEKLQSVHALEWIIQRKATNSLVKHYYWRNPVSTMLWLTQGMLLQDPDAHNTFLTETFVRLPKYIDLSLILFILAQYKKNVFEDEDELENSNWLAHWPSDIQSAILAIVKTKKRSKNTETLIDSAIKITDYSVSSFPSLALEFYKGHFANGLAGQDCVEKLLDHYIENVKDSSLRDEALFLKLQMFLRKNNLTKAKTILDELSDEFVFGSKFGEDIHAVLKEIWAELPSDRLADLLYSMSFIREMTRLETATNNNKNAEIDFLPAIECLQKIIQAPIHNIVNLKLQNCLIKCIDLTRMASGFDKYSPSELESLQLRENLQLIYMKLFPTSEANRSYRYGEIFWQDCLRATLRSVVGCFQEHLHYRKAEFSHQVSTLFNFLPKVVSNGKENKDDRFKTLVTALEKLLEDLPNHNFAKDWLGLEKRLEKMQAILKQEKVSFAEIKVYSEAFVKAEEILVKLIEMSDSKVNQEISLTI